MRQISKSALQCIKVAISNEATQKHQSDSLNWSPEACSRVSNLHSHRQAAGYCLCLLLRRLAAEPDPDFLLDLRLHAAVSEYSSSQRTKSVTRATHLLWEVECRLRFVFLPTQHCVEKCTWVVAAGQHTAAQQCCSGRDESQRTEQKQATSCFSCAGRGCAGPSARPWPAASHLCGPARGHCCQSRCCCCCCRCRYQVSCCCCQSCWQPVGGACEARLSQLVQQQQAVWHLQTQVARLAAAELGQPISSLSGAHQAEQAIRAPQGVGQGQRRGELLCQRLDWQQVPG